MACVAEISTVGRYHTRHTKYRLSNTDFQCDLRLRSFPVLFLRYITVITVSALFAPKDISNVFNFEIIILPLDSLKINRAAGFDYRALWKDIEIDITRQLTQMIYIVRESNQLWQTFHSLFRGERRKIFIRFANSLRKIYYIINWNRRARYGWCTTPVHPQYIGQV